VVRDLNTFIHYDTTTDSTDFNDIVVQFEIPSNKSTANKRKEITEYKVFYTNNENEINNLFGGTTLTHTILNASTWSSISITDPTRTALYNASQYEKIDNVAGDKLYAITVVAYVDNFGNNMAGDIASPDYIYVPKSDASIDTSIIALAGINNKEVDVTVSTNGLITYPTNYAAVINKINTQIRTEFTFTSIQPGSDSTNESISDVTSTSHTVAFGYANYHLVTLSNLRAQRKMPKNRLGVYTDSNSFTQYTATNWVNIGSEINNTAECKVYPKVDISLTGITGAATQSTGAPYTVNGNSALELRGQLSSSLSSLGTDLDNELEFEVEVTDASGAITTKTVQVTSVNTSNELIATIQLTADEDYTDRLQAQLVFTGSDSAAIDYKQNLGNQIVIVEATAPNGVSHTDMLTPWEPPSVNFTLSDQHSEPERVARSDGKYNMKFEEANIVLSDLTNFPTRFKITTATDSSYNNNAFSKTITVDPSNMNLHDLEETVDNNSGGYEYNKLYHYKIAIQIEYNNATSWVDLAVVTGKTAELTTDTDDSHFNIHSTNGEVNTSFSLVTANSAKFSVTLESEVQEIFKAFLDSSSIPSDNDLELQLQERSPGGSSTWADVSGNSTTLPLTKNTSGDYVFADYTFSSLPSNMEYRVEYTMKYDFGEGKGEETAYGTDEATGDVRTYGTPTLTAVSGGDAGQDEISVTIDADGHTIEGASVLVSDNTTLRAATKAAYPAYSEDEETYAFTYSDISNQIKTAIITIQPGHISSVAQEPMVVYIVKRVGSTGAWPTSFTDLNSSSS
jgi:hypothetical protein